MTAIATEPDAHLGVTQIRTGVSEWIKFRSLRSTWWSIGIALLISVGLGILFSALRGNDIADPRRIRARPDRADPAWVLPGPTRGRCARGAVHHRRVQHRHDPGDAVGRAPKRVPVWVAKIAVFATVIFMITLVAAFVAFLGGQAALSGYRFHGQVLTGPNGDITVFAGPNIAGLHSLGVPISHPGSLRAIFGAALFMVGVGLLGLGCGFIIRNTGGAIAALFGLLLVLPLLAQALPSSLQQHVTKYLPLLAGTAGMNTGGGTDQLSPWTGLGVFAIYVVAALGIGLYVLKRRDA